LPRARVGPLSQRPHRLAEVVCSNMSRLKPNKRRVSLMIVGFTNSVRISGICAEVHYCSDVPNRLLAQGHGGPERLAECRIALRSPVDIIRVSAL
jgi:hypothetical protein